MDTPVSHINLFNAILALYVIGYQVSICSDWSWIPMNKEDYQLPYQDKWSRINQYCVDGDLKKQNKIFNMIISLAW